MNFDIAIIGAGPAGLSLACSLGETGLNVVVLEKLSSAVLANPENDGRDIALTHQSYELLNEMGIWQRISEENISPLEGAEVVDGDSAYKLSFKAPANDGPLGYLVANHFIRQAIYQQFETLTNVTLLDETEVLSVSTNSDEGTVQLSNGETIKAALIVAADTRFSQSRQQMGIATDMHDFGRSAVVCKIEHELSHQNIALECFHYKQTMAILPMPGNTASVVITLPTSKVKEVLAMPEDVFNEDIEQRLKSKLGRMTQLGQRFSYPLVAVHANCFVKERFALIGDAAVGMHPVTAHGFNLGLSGQAILAAEIAQAIKENKAIYSQGVLQAYQRQHMLMTKPLYHGTNLVVGLFTNDDLPAKLIRKAVLRISNNSPLIKWGIRRKLMSKKSITSLLPALPSFFSAKK